MGIVHSGRHQGLLGTVVEVSSVAASSAAGPAVAAVVIGEITRLQRVFDAFDDQSELRRWLDGDLGVRPELAEVLALAESWRRRSTGAFDPAAAWFTKAWTVAAAAGAPPSPDDLEHGRRLIAELARPAAPRWSAPTVPYSLNAIAKGWIVDRAVERAWAEVEVDELLVNAGGDLRHRGGPPLTVGIEDPFRPHDNAPPVGLVAVGDGALATSGGARRGWTIDGRWYSHVIDPRTGRPVDRQASVSVVAADAATADVVATIVGVLRTDEALAFLDRTDGVAGCLVSSDGEVRCSDGWPAAAP